MPCRDGGPTTEQIAEDRVRQKKHQERINIATRLACEYCHSLERKGWAIPEWAQDWWKHHKSWDRKRIKLEKEMEKFTHTVVVNAKQHKFIGSRISYEDITDLAEKPYRMDYTVTYFVPNTTIGGIIRPGFDIAVSKNMIFTCVLSVGA